MQSSATEKVAAGLKSAREKLGQLLEGRFTVLANRRLWKEPRAEDRYLAAPIQESDTELMQFVKHALLALEEAERLTHIIDEYTKRTLAGKVLHAPVLLYRAYSFYQSRFKVHLAAFNQLADSAHIPGTAKKSLSTIIQTLTGLNFVDEFGSVKIPSMRATAISSLDTEFFSLVDTHFKFRQPTLPEGKYESPKAKVVPPKKITIHMSVAPAVKAIDPAAAMFTMLENLHEVLSKEIAEKKGVYTETEIAMIEKTMRALKNRTFDKNEFLVIDDKEETPLSETIKVVFNLLWCAHEVHRHPDPGIWALANIGKKAKPYLARLDRFTFNPDLMPENLKALSSVLMKTVLSKAKEELLPGIMEIVKQTHGFEQGNGLRYGALLDEVRPVFDGVEAFYIGQGVAITNPLGVTEEKIRTTPKEHEALYKQKMIAQLKIKLLKNVKAHGFPLNFEDQKDLNWLRENAKFELGDVSTDLFKIEMEEKEISGELAKKSAELESYQEKEKIKLEFLIRSLSSEGLNSVLRAVQVGSGSSDLNLSHKRRLAVFLADYEKQDRSAYLAIAHTKAIDAIKHPPKILIQLAKDLFEGKLGSKNRSLGQLLAMEMTLGGFVQVSDWPVGLKILSGDAHHHLLNALTRLEAGQIVDLLNKSAEGDPAAKQRLSLFASLISDKEIKDSSTLTLTMSDCVDLLVKRYHESDFQELKNKIGLFLGRLAYTNSKNANIVFGRDGAADILKKECLVSNQTLYYEALVNTFSFSYVESESYASFLTRNKKTISAISPDKEIDKLSPVELAVLIEKFIKQNLSSGSQAEKKMREFFSKMAVCTGESKELRREILDISISKLGSKTKYLTLLVGEDEKLFWKRVKEDILNRGVLSFSSEFKGIQSSISSFMGTLPKEKSKEFVKKQDEFIKGKETTIHKKFESLKDEKEGDFSRLCRVFQRKMNSIEISVKNERDAWIKDVVSYHKEDLIKALSEHKKIILGKMKESKMDDSYQKKVIALMSEYHPEAKMDSYGKTSEEMMKRKAEIITDIESQVAAWKGNVENKKKLDSIKGIFSISSSMKEDRKKKLQEILGSIHNEKYNNLFLETEKYWEDSGKLSVLVNELQKGIADSKAILPELAVRLDLEAKPLFDDMTNQMKSALSKCIDENNTEKLASIIRHFPEQKTPPENSLRVALLLADKVKRNLLILNKELPDFMEKSSFSESHKKEFELAIATCLAEQKEMVQKVLNELPADYEKSLGILKESQHNLQEKLDQITNIHLKNLKHKLEDQCKNALKSIESLMDGKVSEKFKKEKMGHLQGINLSNQLDGFNIFLQSQDPRPGLCESLLRLEEQTKKYIADFGNQFSMLQIEISYEVRKTNSEIASLSSIINNIKNELQEYHHKRSGVQTKIYSVFNRPLRSQKVDMVSTCLEEIRKIEEKLKAPGENGHFDECAQDLIKQIDSLNRSHAALVKTGKESGDLGRNIEAINKQVSPLKEGHVAKQKPEG